jgi:hypothetical protein
VNKDFFWNPQRSSSPAMRSSPPKWRLLGDVSILPSPRSVSSYPQIYLWASFCL